MSKRSRTFTKSRKGDIFKTFPGTWSNFDFDFSRASIFYPLNNLTIEQGNFASTRFYGEADFRGAKFTILTSFGNAQFTGNANFRNAQFTRNANFGNANFGNAQFTGLTIFGNAQFTRNANFRNAQFAGNTNFRNTQFTGNTDFKGAYFKKYAPTFADASNSARFSAQADPQDYIFSVRKGSKPINCGTATFDGKSFEIPLGAVLCDPVSWDEEEQDYTRLSESAQ